MDKGKKRLIISFSGRKNGNCDQIAAYLATEPDRVVHFADLKAHACSDCDYPCFRGSCPNRGDGVYELYAAMPQYDQIILIVPIYCGNPPSLYFLFNERGQDYFSHNDTYEAIVDKLYLIGVYGSRELAPRFIPCLEQWFEGSGLQNRVLGIERHSYGQRLTDRILDVAEVRERLDGWLAADRPAEDGKAGADDE